jgi:hypothetical protein
MIVLGLLFERNGLRLLVRMSISKGGQPPVAKEQVGRKKWGKQDSNLRRLSHQIYSLAPLAAREFPLNQSRFSGELTGVNPSTDAVASPMSHLMRRGKLAVGLEPTTSGLQNRGSAD